MARFCTECGKEIADNMAFCTECGAKAPVDTAPEVVETAQPKVETPPVAEPQPQSAQQVYQQPQQTYQQPAPQPVYHQPAPQQTHQQPAPAVDPDNKAVGTGTYFWLMFLFSIPIIGFIICIIMAFAPRNKSLKNYAKATLIWVIIALVLAGIMAIIFAILGNSLMLNISQLAEGQIADYGSFLN